VQPNLPEDVRLLLWDQDPGPASQASARPLLFERVMTRGSLQAMRWLLASFSREELRAFVQGPRGGALPPRELAFWCTVLEVELPQRARQPGGGRPGWAG
jgi:hypothetical protein